MFRYLTKSVIATFISDDITVRSDVKKHAILCHQVLQMLIDDFGVADMFGRKNIQYFADVTQTGIRVREKYRYEYHYPPEDSAQCE